MEEKIFLPVLHSFENNNVFTGSCGSLRYKVTPTVPKEEQQAPSMTCEVWYGELCYELSEVADRKTFALTQEALEELRAWIAQHVRQEGGPA